MTLKARSDRGVVLIAAAEISPELIPQLDLLVGQLPHALPVALDVRDGVELVLPENVGAIVVAALGFRTVEVMQQQALNEADIAFDIGLGPGLPLEAPGGVGRAIANDIGAQAARHLANQSVRHVAVGGTDDAEVDQAAEVVPGIPAAGPGIARMPHPVGYDGVRNAALAAHPLRNEP